MPPHDRPSRGLPTRDLERNETTDLATVEQLCWLHLTARRLGCRMLVHDASPELRALICLVGLGEVLLADMGPASRPGP